MRWLGEGLEVMKRSGALGEAQYLGDGFDGLQSVNLIVRQLQHGHLGEAVQRAAIAFEEGLRSVKAEAVLGACLASGEQEAGGHSLDVPLEGASDGFVEIVDVEDEAAIGRGKGPKVANVRIATELGENTRVGAKREIAGHDGHRSAEETEGRNCHAVVLDGSECGNAAAHGVGEELQRIGAAEFGLPFGENSTGRVLALGLAEGDAFAEGEGSGHVLLGY